MTAERIWAVLPVKRFSTAKARLAPILSGDDRCALAEAILRDTLSAVTSCAAIAGVAVVTSEEKAADISTEAGFEVVRTSSDEGHTAAAQAGVDALRGRASGVLILSTDIPLVQPKDLAFLISLHGPAPAVTLARAVADSGTNALIVSPPDIIGFRFGKNSEALHAEAARKAGAAFRSVVVDRMAFDLDRPEDVGRFLDTPSPTFTYQLLRHLQDHGRMACQTLPKVHRTPLPHEELS